MASGLTAALGMVRRPGEVVLATLTSGFTSRVLLPHLYLPLIGWRWFIGILPVVVLYGASNNAQLRAFGIYYSIVLVPFLVLGAVAGAELVSRLLTTHRGRSRAIAATAIVSGALVGGISYAGYSVRPWRSEISALPNVLRDLGDDQFILVQSGLYPHAGYSPHIQLLSDDTLGDQRYRAAFLVLAPRLDTYSLSPESIGRLARLPSVASTPSGLVVGRRPD